MIIMPKGNMTSTNRNVIILLVIIGAGFIIFGFSYGYSGGFMPRAASTPENHIVSISGNANSLINEYTDDELLGVDRSVSVEGYLLNLKEFDGLEATLFTLLQKPLYLMNGSSRVFFIGDTSGMMVIFKPCGGKWLVSRQAIALQLLEVNTEFLGRSIINSYGCDLIQRYPVASTEENHVVLIQDQDKFYTFWYLESLGVLTGTTMILENTKAFPGSTITDEFKEIKESALDDYLDKSLYLTNGSSRIFVVEGASLLNGQYYMRCIFRDSATKKWMVQIDLTAFISVDQGIDSGENYLQYT